MQMHRESADLVADSMTEHGWLDAELVGHEGAEAAFLLVANAYSQGPLNHRVIESMQSSVDADASPLRSLAMLQDRGRFLRSLPVIYRTVGDFDAIEVNRQRIIETYADRDYVLRPEPQKYAEERRELANVGNW